MEYAVGILAAVLDPVHRIQIVWGVGLGHDLVVLSLAVEMYERMYCQSAESQEHVRWNSICKLLSVDVHAQTMTVV